MIDWVLSTLLYVCAFGAASMMIQKSSKHVGGRMLLWIGLLIPTLIGGFRYNVGADFMRYMDKYADLINPLPNLRYPDTMEFTFNIFSQLSHALTASPALMFTIYSAITIVAYYHANKVLRIKHIGISMFIYQLVFFLNSFNITRQSAAMAVASIGLAFLIRGNAKKAFLFIALASCLHLSTGVIVLPIAFTFLIVGKRFIHLKNYKRYLNTVVMSSILVAVFSASIIVFVGVLAASYTDMFGRIDLNFISATPSLGFIFKLFLGIAGLVLIRRRWAKVDLSDRKLFILISWGVVLYMLGIWQNELQRPGLYLLVLAPMMYATLLDKSKGLLSLRYRVILSRTLVISCILFVWFAVAYNTSSGYVYETIFDNLDYKQTKRELGI